MARDDFIWAWSLLVDCGLPKSPPIADDEEALRSAKTEETAQVLSVTSSVGLVESGREADGLGSECVEQLHRVGVESNLHGYDQCAEPLKT